VRAVESGVVVFTELFTGPRAGSPWWEETAAIGVLSDRWLVCYGELRLLDLPSEGDRLRQGETFGKVARVLRNDKGLPTTMLHFELYDRLTTSPTWWQSGAPKPQGLLDPTDLLIAARRVP
jgi:hypothetical protein